MDGIHHADRYVVEVKNRTKSFFSYVRDYENTQVQMYLYMLDFEKAKLVERHRAKIRVTDIQRSEEYIELTLEKLRVFIDGFMNFLQTPVEDKVSFLLNNDKEAFLETLFLRKVHGVMKKQSIEREHTHCLIDDLSDPLD
jgi:hypothetical protein